MIEISYDVDQDEIESMQDALDCLKVLHKTLLYEHGKDCDMVLNTCINIIEKAVPSLQHN